MKKTGRILFLLFISVCIPCLGVFPKNSNAADADSPTPEMLPAQPEPDEGLKTRRFHETALFILGHYAMLESCIAASAQGKLENQSFLIGGASLAIPGAGQIVNQDYLQGGLVLYSGLLSWTTVQNMGIKPRTAAKNRSLLPWYYTSLVFRDVIMNYAMLHAANARYREHRDRTAAIWTGAASLLPGAGQAVNGDWWEAGAFLAAWSVLAAVTAAWERELFPVREMTGKALPSAGQVQCSLAMLPNGCGLILSSEW